MLARFLRDLGVDGRDIPVDEAERAARYRTTLARRRMLVVLDNARDAAQVRPLLPGTASSAVLVTTRSRMPDLASTKLVDLNVLDDDEALKLFIRVVGEERAAAEPEATAELLLSLRRPAAGHQDLRGAAGHPQRLDHPGHGGPAPRRAPQAR